MNTPPLPLERKVLSSYREVSRTFTYGILATLPAFLIYDFGTLFLNIGNDGPWELNGVHGAMGKFFIYIGLPPETTFIFVLAIMTILWCYEGSRNKINIHPFFFVKTFTESAFVAVLTGSLALLLVKLNLYHPELQIWEHIRLGKEFLPNLVSSCGDGFYDNLVVAFIISYLTRKKFAGWYFPQLFTAILFAASVFSFLHSPMLLEYRDVPFDHAVFLYKTALGVIFGIIYAIRGFGTMVWTHVLFNFWLLSGLF